MPRALRKRGRERYEENAEKEAPFGLTSAFARFRSELLPSWKPHEESFHRLSRFARACLKTP
jgi:hypothetical protein